MMFVTALNQSNDNLEKLNHNKAIAVTMIFENKVVYLGNWNCLNICIFAKQDSTLTLLYQAADYLKENFSDLIKAFEKINIK